MKNGLNPEELTLVMLAKEYADEDKARALFESFRWPQSPVCPHCKAGEPYKLIANRSSKRPGRAGLYKCRECRKQFTATVGTIFEGSHISIATWLQATFLLCASKKGISAHQLHRMLGITYKSAWFMAHRLRYAMQPGMPLAAKLDGVLEYDETYCGGKPRNPGEGRATRAQRLTPVLALVQRNGEVRTKVVADVTAPNVYHFLKKNAEESATVCTDQALITKWALKGRNFRHESVNHAKKEWARKEPDGLNVTTNHAESFFSLIKRSLVGAFHHVSKEHLPKYADEVAFRWNRRSMTDGERMGQALKCTVGKRLTYKPLTTHPKVEEKPQTKKRMW